MARTFMSLHSPSPPGRMRRRRSRSRSRGRTKTTRSRREKSSYSRSRSRSPRKRRSPYDSKKSASARRSSPPASKQQSSATRHESEAKTSASKSSASDRRGKDRKRSASPANQREQTYEQKRSKLTASAGNDERGSDSWRKRSKSSTAAAAGSAAAPAAAGTSVGLSSPVKKRGGLEQTESGTSGLLTTRTVSAIREPPHVVKRRQRYTLSDRFRDLPGNPSRGPVVELYISVDIKRKVSGAPVYTVDRSYNPDCVAILRRKDEGLKPMFDREEIKQFRYDENDELIETRVVKARPSGPAGATSSAASSFAKIGSFTQRYDDDDDDDDELITNRQKSGKTRQRISRFSGIELEEVGATDDRIERERRNKQRETAAAARVKNSASRSPVGKKPQRDSRSRSDSRRRRSLSRKRDKRRSASYDSDFHRSRGGGSKGRGRSRGRSSSESSDRDSRRSRTPSDDRKVQHREASDKTLALKEGDLRYSLIKNKKKTAELEKKIEEVNRKKKVLAEFRKKKLEDIKKRQANINKRQQNMKGNFGKLAADGGRNNAFRQSSSSTGRAFDKNSSFKPTTSGQAFGSGYKKYDSRGGAGGNQRKEFKSPQDSNKKKFWSPNKNAPFLQHDDRSSPKDSTGGGGGGAAGESVNRNDKNIGSTLTPRPPRGMYGTTEDRLELEKYGGNTDKIGRPQVFKLPPHKYTRWLMKDRVEAVLQESGVGFTEGLTASRIRRIYEEKYEEILATRKFGVASFFQFVTIHFSRDFEIDVSVKPNKIKLRSGSGISSSKYQPRKFNNQNFMNRKPYQSSRPRGNADAARWKHDRFRADSPAVSAAGSSNKSDRSVSGLKSGFGSSSTSGQVFGNNNQQQQQQTAPSTIPTIQLRQ
ncbi:uncharacterized protein LOC141909614 [Tubulanus polymorphus]|uniref:uncharacterized protein LOC141909614 n=1 Tax=Tubulanus polymorphus TaxID=672921 RepID=UPI003DA4AEF2